MRSCKSVRGVELEDAISLTPSSRRGLASKVLMPSRPGDVGGRRSGRDRQARTKSHGRPWLFVSRERRARFLNELQLAWPTGTRLRRRVQSSGLGGLGRDPLSKCLRGEHLSMRSVGEEVVERMVDPFELRDHRRALPLLDDTGRSEVADLAAGDAHCHPRSARALARTPPTGGRRRCRTKLDWTSGNAPLNVRVGDLLGSALVADPAAQIALVSGVEPD